MYRCFHSDSSFLKVSHGFSSHLWSVLRSLVSLRVIKVRYSNSIISSTFIHWHSTKWNSVNHLVDLKCSFYRKDKINACFIYQERNDLFPRIFHRGSLGTRGFLTCLMSPLITPFLACVSSLTSGVLFMQLLQIVWFLAHLVFGSRHASVSTRCMYEGVPGSS